MKQFTQEMLDTLHQADRQLRGTPDYGKYKMELHYKVNPKSRWEFLCWSLPSVPGQITTYGKNIYIITEHCGNIERFEVTEEVRKLLNI